MNENSFFLLKILIQIYKIISYILIYFKFFNKVND
jgi:hypothetical protein